MFEKDEDWIKLARKSRSIALIALLTVSLAVGAMAVQGSGVNVSPLQPTDHPRDFSVSIVPSFLSILRGGSGSATVNLASFGQFSGVITLSATITPSTNSTPSLSLNPSALRLRSGGSVNSTLTISTGPQTTTGNYTVTVLAQAAKVSHTSHVSVFVVPSPDFSLTLQPSSETVGILSVKSSFYTLTSLFGFSGAVSITPSNIPTGVGVGIQTPPPLTPGGTFTGVLSINVDNNAIPGTYAVVFSGQSGSTTHNAILSLTIIRAPPDFTIASTPTFLSIPQGSTGMVFVLLTGTGGFNGTVSLTSGVIPLISGGPTAVLNQSSVFLNAGITRGIELRIITTPTTPIGSYNYTVTGSSGSLTHTAIGAFTVTPSSPPPPPDFSISANPTSLTIPQGSSNRIFLNLTSLNSFSGTINLVAAVSPTGPRLVLGANSVTLNSGGTTQVVLAVFVNSTVPPPAGSYLITAAGSSGSLSHSVNIQLTVTSTMASLAVVSFSFQPTNVTLQLHNQGGGTVSLDGYQVGNSLGDNWTRTGWSGPTLNPNTTAQALITIGVSCPSCTYAGVAGRFNQFTAGNTYTITVIGSNRQAFSFALTFSSAREGLSLDSSSFFSGTNVTLFLRNIGNVSISLVSYFVKDASGNQYALTSWAGPTIGPGSVFPAQILIGASCPSCTLTGNAFTFTPGQSYTILLVTGRNNQFTFTVTR